MIKLEIKDIDTIVEVMTKTQKAIENLHTYIDSCKKGGVKDDFMYAYEDRIATLEIKMAKLWEMLVRVDSRTKEEKPNKFARRYGQMFQS
jgi:hypothetical protein